MAYFYIIKYEKFYIIKYIKKYFSKKQEAIIIYIYI